MKIGITCYPSVGGSGILATGLGEELAGAFDVLRANDAGEQAVMADAVEAGGQHVEEKAADELGGVERHGPEPVAAFDPVVLVWGFWCQGFFDGGAQILRWLNRVRNRAVARLR